MLKIYTATLSLIEILKCFYFGSIFKVIFYFFKIYYKSITFQIHVRISFISSKVQNTFLILTNDFWISNWVSKRVYTRSKYLVIYNSATHLWLFLYGYPKYKSTNLFTIDNSTIRIQTNVYLLLRIRRIVSVQYFWFVFPFGNLFSFIALVLNLKIA